MKPIPAIDENGDWIEAEIVDGSRVMVLAWGVDGDHDYAHTLVGRHVWRMDADTFNDWPAIRERVERARKAREAALQHAADVIQQDIAAQHGVCQRPKRPSFAEALEAELRGMLSPLANAYSPEVKQHLALCDAIKRARAASGE